MYHLLIFSEYLVQWSYRYCHIVRLSILKLKYMYEIVLNKIPRYTLRYLFFNRV